VKESTDNRIGSIKKTLTEAFKFNELEAFQQYCILKYISKFSDL